MVVLNGNRCVSVSSSNPGHFIIGGMLKTSSPLKSLTIKPDRNMNIDPFFGSFLELGPSFLILDSGTPEKYGENNSGAFSIDICW